MKWEDTVLDDRQLEIHCGVGINHHIPREKKREAQAEFSFKAGVNSILTELHSPSNLVQAARQEGVREVVEWIEAHSAKIWDNEYDARVVVAREFNLKEWQAFLKEKGIEVKSE